MARSIVVATLGALALAAGPVDAQEPPSLEPPLEAAPADDPPTPPTVARPKPAEPPHTPLLVIPGVTAPRASRPAAPRPPADPLPEPAAPPTLAGPSSAPAPVDIPLRLEPISPQVRSRPREVAPQDDGAAGPRSAFPRPEPATTTAAPARRTAPGTARERDADKVESTGDPAVEAAVRRRVEKQVRDALGGRVKDVDVKVSGRNVVVRARASRFWYRWTTRRTLNSLPMPAGYRARVELLD